MKQPVSLVAGFIFILLCHQSLYAHNNHDQALNKPFFDQTFTLSWENEDSHTMRAKPQKKSDGAEWTIFMIIEARNNLSSFASKNLQDIAAMGSNSRVNIIIQWHQYNQPGTWRYKVDKNKVTIDHVDHDAETDNSVNNLIDFVTWGVDKYPAEKYFLVFWDHGSGIVDPIWGKDPSRIMINDFGITEEPLIHVNGITELTTDKDRDNKRGILFDEENRVYMSNQDLTVALDYLTKNVTKRPFDVIGMDACFMGMLEIAYQLRNYAKVFVGSEEVELAYGWNYTDFLTQFLSRSHSPEETGRAIVKSYEQLYKGRTHLYTQSAIDLKQLEPLKKNIDKVARSLHSCVKKHGSEMKQAIRKARNNCLQFSSPAYVDMHSFYTALFKEIDLQINPNTQALPQKIKKRPKDGIQGLSPESADSGQIKELKLLLSEGLYIINQAVIANTASTHLSRAKGLSFYYPRYVVEGSYLTTEFGIDSDWSSFLSETLGS